MPTELKPEATTANPTWTEEELTTFDKLVDDQSSSDQMTRISARLDIQAFAKLHGKEKCDAMFAHLEAERKKLVKSVKEVMRKDKAKKLGQPSKRTSR